MANIIKPSTALLPMEDIANVLKEQYKFSSKSDVALDTSKVANTDAKLIAIAATDESGKLIKDRETVKNTLMLNDIPASDYMTRQDGVRIENFGDNVSKVFSEDLADLRDELYQLRGELSRRGLIKDHGPYAGFQDFFRTGDVRYLDESIGGITFISEDSTTIHLTNGAVINTGDIFVINNGDMNYIVKATSVNNEEVTISNLSQFKVSILAKDISSVKLYHILGEYSKGGFSFSKIEEKQTSDNERYTMLNDDSNPKLESIKIDNAGFAVSFNVPYAVKGALKKFSVMAKSTNKPGVLNCYVMKDTELNRALIKNIDDEYIKTESAILAKATPIDPSIETMSSHAEFTFDFKKEDGSYIELEGQTRYLFFVVAATADINNYWEIQFSKNAYDNLNPDVHSNNKAYRYIQNSGLIEENTIGDMIFILATSPVDQNVENPSTEGLYTSQEIKLHNINGVARARLTLRINREGLFVAENTGISDVIKIAFDPNSINNTFPMGSDLGIAKDDNIAIGTNIRKVEVGCKDMNIALAEDVNIKTGDPVYRIGYEAYLRVAKETWNTQTSTFDISNEQLVPMNLICVMPDKFKSGPYHSDRLIFECEFRDPETNLTLDINKAELQILWKSNNSYQDINNNKTLTGRIYDLTLSFDRTI